MPTLTAGTGISTTSPNGVTNIVIATTTSGPISMTGGQSITFRELTAGGAGGNVTINSAAFVIGVQSLTATNYQAISPNTAIDGSITAGGNVAITGAGIGLLNITAGGTVSITAQGFAYTPSYLGPQLIGVEPDLLNAVTNLWAVEASPSSLALFNAAGGYLTHCANYTVSSTSVPLNFTFLTRTLTEVTAGLLTLSPTAPPAPPASGTWQQAVQFAYFHTPVGTGSGPTPYP